MDRSQQTYGQGRQNRKCRDHGPSQRRHVVSLSPRLVQTWHLCGGYCGKEIEMPGSALPVIDKQYRAGVPARCGWRRTRNSGGRTLHGRRGFPRKVFPCTISSPPLQVSSTSYNWKTFEERGGSVCIERGCGPRMCHCAHHRNCSLLINARSCDHSPRARRSDCVSGDSSQCRQSEAQRNHCQRFHHEGDGEVSEAGSKLTDPVVRQLLLSRGV